MIANANESDFDSHVAEGVTLVDFWAAWCAPCRMIAPVLDEISTKYEGRAKVVKVNVDENPNISMKFGIQGIPAVFLFKDGQLTETTTGARGLQFYEELLDKHLQAA